MEAQKIRFYCRGQVREVWGVAPTRTLLQYLREDLRATGTKEGCAEGDCGACTVVIGDLDAHGAVRMRAVNACIQLLPTLDGKAVFTVEDLGRPGGALHPVQQAMVDLHGSQCGFCTPGFVMSMWALYVEHAADAPPPSRAHVQDVLSGNLCRCTGYRPIIDAALAMFSQPRAAFDVDALAGILAGLRRGAALDYAHEGHTFRAPRTLAELAKLRLAHPHARILAGGTDVALWVTKQLRPLTEVIYVGEVDALREIRTEDGHLYIGAGALLSDAFDALAAQYDELRELRRRFASYPIRNAGTLGGNVANGSPIGDSMPVLIALGTRIVLRRGDHVRTLPLEDFYLDYQKNAFEVGEFMQGLEIPLRDQALRLRSYKLSKRFDQDISAVCAAFAIHLGAGGEVAQARIAFGGMAATPRRALLAEQALVGRPWNDDTAQAAMQALARDYTPMSDMRAGSAYRISSAQHLLWRFYLETRPEAPLSPAQVNVYACADAQEEQV
ncbi:xanthine dehydrogenase small subunit [Paracandidimonas lactea]|uniref:xanthine dehydrogenase small subunit n=1 Tax=Paracandidimonas lactea TaxID=2895524 RepID=UPI001F00CD77|nr:xanthine dehydrogenase small subunit [Paracandidimonas lactea]